VERVLPLLAAATGVQSVLRGGELDEDLPGEGLAIQRRGDGGEAAGGPARREARRARGSAADAPDAPLVDRPRRVRGLSAQRGRERNERRRRADGDRDRLEGRGGDLESSGRTVAAAE